ncbi:MAG: DUF262 domain-containing HNH endonuclease family protein [Gammaproteobacteria bacterium]
MEVSKKTINDIFNGTRILEIPFFQRAYVWGTEQWARFLEDMKHISQNQTPYFFGSVILKQQPKPTTRSVGDVRWLVDGQQRLTTLIIFFKTISLKDDGYKHLYEKKFLLQRDSSVLALLHNHNDIQSFEKICNLKKSEQISKKDAEKNNILGAYKFFEENVKVEELDFDVIDSNLMVVSIDLPPEEDEQQIFDTINSLGVQLTTAELLKNYFFNRGEVNLYKQNWKEIFEKDDDTKEYWDREISVGRMPRTFIDLFFYAYLQIKVQEPVLQVSGKDKNNFARVNSIFDSYKKLIKTYSLDKGEIIAEIKTYASIFRENFDYGDIERELPAAPGIERINAVIFRLEHSTLVPYTLFILKNLDDEETRKNLFVRIESYVMRRIVVKATSQNYNLLFSRMIGERILSEAQFRAHIEKSEDHVNFLPTDADLKKGFAESKLINKQSAGILYLIESKIGERHKHATRLEGIAHYSLEHLMPKKWANKWKLPPTQDESERNRVLLTLGNLAIIPQPLNAAVKNADWETKKKGVGDGKDGLKHFASGLETMLTCLEVTDWNEREIEKRADWLCEKAIEIWPAK